MRVVCCAELCCAVLYVGWVGAALVCGLCCVGLGLCGLCERGLVGWWGLVRM